MGMAGVVPSTDTFNTLMGACLSRGDPGAVPRLFRRLISLGHTPDALSYTSLITSLTRLGRPEDAVSPAFMTPDFGGSFASRLTFLPFSWDIRGSKSMSKA